MHSYAWCEGCEKQITTQIFQGEKWCSEACRKKVMNETDGPDSALKKVKKK